MIKRLSYYYHFLQTLFKTNVRLLWGMWKLTKLPQPAITIFGGSRTLSESPEAQQARQLAKKLAGAGFSIITGGGPGIMEAANLGAIEYLGECQIDAKEKHCKPLVSAGISLVRLNKETANPYVQENIVMEHFFARKWLLVRYAIGFVVFPGGFGTLDELFEIITLIQTQRMPRTPVILMGKKYWEPIKEWIFSKALAQGLITEKESHIIQIMDDVNEAFEFIEHCCSVSKK